jgi:hypothetical protein
MITPGTPEKEKPVTSYAHSSVTFRQCSPTWYQTDGIDADRCGSLASSGLPLAVCSPATTHELEPRPSRSAPPRVPGTAASVAAAWVSTRAPARGSSFFFRRPGSAAWSKRSWSIVPCVTIGSCSSYGYSG